MFRRLFMVLMCATSVGMGAGAASAQNRDRDPDVDRQRDIDRDRDGDGYRVRDVEAGPEARDWELTLTGSGSNDKDFDNGGFGASGSLGYYFNDNVELAFRQGLNFSKSDTAGSRTAALSRFALDYHFDGGRIQPFIGANLGYVYGDAVRESFAAAPEVGFKFYVRPETFIMLMGEYQFFFEDSSDASDEFDDGQFVYTIGMGFTF